MHIKIITYLIFIIFFSTNSTLSIENKIILKINNSIITNLDVVNEANYLQALNPNLQNLEKNKILEIAKNSLIREKIKEIEILKTSTRNVNPDYLESLIQSIYTNIGFKNKNEFIEHIEKFNINIQTIEKKISNETLWNQLIYKNFFSITLSSTILPNDLGSSATSTPVLIIPIVDTPTTGTHALINRRRRK